MSNKANGQSSQTQDPSALSDLELFNTDSAFFSTLLNKAIGIGNAAYDTSFFDEISETRYLTDSEIINLYDSSRIAKTIVNLYPSDCNFGVVNTNSNSITAEDITKYLNHKLPKSIEYFFRCASQQARKWGVHYLILGFDDGQGLNQPLDESNIKSLEWIETLSKDQLFPEGFPNLYDTEYYYFYSDSRYFNQQSSNGEKLKGRIHCSRVLRFLGEITDLKTQLYKPRFLSCLQSSVSALLAKDKAIALANQLLLKKAVLYAQLKVAGSANVEASREKLQDRLSYVNLLQSIYRMVGLGTEESLSALQIDLGNVDSILRANISELVSSTGIVRSKLMGESAQEGLGQSSRGLENRLEHAQRCSEWVKDFWFDHLLRFYNLLGKTEELVGKNYLSEISVSFPTNLELFPKEVAELRELNSHWAVAYLDKGILTPSEIRQTFAPSNILEQLVPNLALDKKYTKNLAAKSNLVTKPDSNPESNLVTKPDSNQDSEDKSDKISDGLSKEDQKVLDRALELLSESLDSDQIDSILSKI